ncbi:E3 ubiquitin-protein ligase pub1, partial [Dimargaris cristalligena]
MYSNPGHHPAAPQGQAYPSYPPQHAQGDPSGAGHNPSPGAVAAGSEEGCRSLYVGNLDPRVTEDMLRDIFNTLGKVQSVKLIADRN